MSDWFKRNWWKLVIVYVIVGLLTFGNSWNDSLKCEPLPKFPNSKEWNTHWDCTHPDSALRGILWPILFIGEAAIFVTK